jgi:hypothetical protein
MSEFTLGFLQRLSYRQYRDIAIEIQLSHNLTKKTPIIVKLDTGSDYCVFHRLYVETIGPDSRKRPAAAFSHSNGGV